MLEFVKETLLLLPFLFATYLVLEAVEAHAGGTLEGLLERARSIGPLCGGVLGAIPQCGVSAAAASFYAGGVITVGTLIAVLLSTSDELLPVLISKQVPVLLMVKIVLIKIAAAILIGFSVDAVRVFCRRLRRPVSVSDLCEHSHCHCVESKGIVKPALIHTLEVFFFIVLVSGAIALSLRFFGADALMRLHLTTPVFGELAAGALGLIPNCAVSVAGAELYCQGAMSGGALMASSFTGSGIGLIVLFRTNRSLAENLAILGVIYVSGVVLGILAGGLL